MDLRIHFLIIMETDSYIKLLGLNNQRNKYGKINEGFNKAENTVLDGVDAIIEKEARSYKGSGIDISYGFGTFNLGDINNNGDKVFRYRWHKRYNIRRLG